MKKVEIDKNELKKLVENGLKIKELSDIFGVSIATIKRNMSEIGVKSNYSVFKNTITKCLCCEEEFTDLKSNNRKFCSSSCSATFNNKLKVKIEKEIKVKPKRERDYRSVGVCLNCECEIIKNDGKGERKYCSLECQSIFKVKSKFEKIKNGDITLNFKQYKKYLIHKYGNKCMDCGWDKVNSYSGKVPIELEHIDGNSENNSLDNLKLLCPNCHSLTPTYKALNVGKGRHSRRERYKEGKSF